MLYHSQLIKEVQSKVIVTRKSKHIRTFNVRLRGALLFENIVPSGGNTSYHVVGSGHVSAVVGTYLG
jgi:hypothetical protein